jgi:uncharacterized lipoprotein YddW (UPF0748 family)
MDTIIVRVFQNEGDRKYPFVTGEASVGVYFKTTKAPVVEDILTPLSELAHRHGLRLFAWMTTRALDWIPADRGWSDRVYVPDSGGMVPSRRLDLFNPEVVAYLQDLYRDLAASPIDGILFQDDLVYRQHEGFTPGGIEGFQRDFGVEPTPQALYGGSDEPYRPLFWRWSGWKSRWLLQVADDLMTESRKVRPDLAFILNLNYEALSDPVHALAWLSEDFLEARRHPFDYYAVMTYHRQMMKETRKDLDGTLTQIREIREKMSPAIDDPARLIVKIQAVDWDTGLPIPVEELERVSAGVGDLGDNSLAYVFNGGAPPLHFLGEIFRPGTRRILSPFIQ